MRTEWTRLLLGAALCVDVTCGPACGLEENSLSEISWQSVSDSGALQSGQLAADETTGDRVLMISHSGPGPVVFPLVAITEPGINTTAYGVRGQVRYEGVGGTGFLEMWNYFPDGTGFFSRTLSTGGALQMISGDSPWRAFTVPADISEAPDGAKPNRLVINLVLPESGTVWISDLELVEWSNLPDLSAVPGAWWGDRTAGVFGGGVGGLLGVLLGVSGMLIGMGRARVFVTVVLMGTAALGAVCLIAGFVALTAAQPYAVTYPLLLIGALGLFFGIGGLPMSRTMYRQRELRQMQALDA